MVNDADDAGVRRNFGRIKREACFLAANEEYGLADTRTDRVDGDECAAGIRTIRADRLQDQQFDSRERVVLARDDDVSDHLCQLHLRIYQFANRRNWKWR